MKLTIAIIFILLPGLAHAHSWYDKQCCHDQDCHPVPCEEITAMDGGFSFIDPKSHATYFFTRDKMKPSQDDNCHVCIFPEGHSPLCLYLPTKVEK